MKKEDLKEGDIFVAGTISSFINKHTHTGKGYGIYNSSYKSIYNNDWTFSYCNIRKATPEEAHHLEECIKLNKFIPYNEAMKTFNITKNYKILSYIGNATHNIFNLQDNGTFANKCNSIANAYLLNDIEIYSINSVSNIEGNIFKIGDVITTKESLIPVTIKYIKKSEKGDAILINFNNIKNININNIEHYISEKNLIEEAKQLYPIGCLVKRDDGLFITIKDSSLIMFNGNKTVITYNYGEVLLYNEKVWRNSVKESNLEKAKRLYPLYTVCKNKTYTTIFVSDGRPYEVNDGCILIRDLATGLTRTIYNNHKLHPWWSEILK